MAIGTEQWKARFSGDNYYGLWRGMKAKGVPMEMQLWTPLGWVDVGAMCPGGITRFETKNEFGVTVDVETAPLQATECWGIS